MTWRGQDKIHSICLRQHPIKEAIRRTPDRQMRPAFSVDLSHMLQCPEHSHLNKDHRPSGFPRECWVASPRLLYWPFSLASRTNAGTARCRSDCTNSALAHRRNSGLWWPWPVSWNGTECLSKLRSSLPTSSLNIRYRFVPLFLIEWLPF